MDILKFAQSKAAYPENKGSLVKILTKSIRTEESAFLLFLKGFSASSLSKSF